MYPHLLLTYSWGKEEEFMIIKKITDIPVDIIEVNPDQPRRIFGEDELMELTESIK